MTYLKILIYALATLMATSTLVFADDDDDDDEIPFEEGWLFFELNDTDGDLGIHAKIDGDAWKKTGNRRPQGAPHVEGESTGQTKTVGLD